jgi:hypothetical protein
MDKEITSLLAIETLMKEKMTEIRRMQAMPDVDLARLYGVELKMLQRQVNRNKDRFPGDFMFRLTKEEWKRLKLKNRRKVYAFTEAGILMAGGILQSERAIKTHMQLIEYFVGHIKLLDIGQETDGTVKEIFQLIKLMKNEF